jgi:tetrapyrrole methylase family protein / MazG family protein
MAPSITIVGLGPGDPNLITREAWHVLQEADEIHLRTVHHPTVAGLPDRAQIHSFDALYEAHATFEEVYVAIARHVVELGARPQGVILAVPGHPLVGETVTRRVLDLASESGLPVRIVAGISFLEPTVTALGVDSFDGLQICDATILAQQHHPNLDPDVAALVVQLYNRALAGEVKMTLMNLYHDDHPLRLVRGAGIATVHVDDIPLYALDRRDDLDHLTTVYIPPLEHAGSLASYQDVVARLRGPGGCPWDREQTHQSLRTHLIEESYEVLAALDADDPTLLQEELGDLLLQILLHAQIASEGGDFKLIDSVQVAIEKLVRRHPHVFGAAQADTPDEVLRSWEQIKRAERGEDTFRSMLAGINKALPALAQALEVQRRVARVGFDWPNPEPVADKVREELEELAEAEAPEARVAEFGDLLFSLVNLARWYDIDAESALREANSRFMRRFAALEQYAAETGMALEEMSLEQMDALWEEAKRNES